MSAAGKNRFNSGCRPPSTETGGHLENTALAGFTLSRAETKITSTDREFRGMVTVNWRHDSGRGSNLPEAKGRLGRD